MPRSYVRKTARGVEGGGLGATPATPTEEEGETATLRYSNSLMLTRRRLRSSVAPASAAMLSSVRFLNKALRLPLGLKGHKTISNPGQHG